MCIRDNEVYFVDKDVYFCRWGELEEGGEDGDVSGQIVVDVVGFDVEDVDEDVDVGEDVDVLLGEVVFYEGFLFVIVLQVEGEVVEEFDVREVDVDSCVFVF